MNHPLDVDDIQHASTCACLHTPSLRAIHSACSCGALADAQRQIDSLKDEAADLMDNPQYKLRR